MRRYFDCRGMHGKKLMDQGMDDYEKLMKTMRMLDEYVMKLAS